MRLLLGSAGLALLCWGPTVFRTNAAERPEFRAGVASQVITPAEPLWMAGYAFRNKPAEAKVHDLYVKVLALEDARGHRLVLLTSDLIGLPRSQSEQVAAEIQRRTGLPRECLMLTVSHTHCGPVVQDSLTDMYDMPAAQTKKVAAYTAKLRGWMVETIVRALADLRPSRLSLGMGSAGFAMNRRQQTAKGFSIGANPKGPVDHDVPVLRVQTPEGKLRAVVFGYACHNTTLQSYEWCGDYAGFAQEYVQEKHPEALALFWIGCGADANPMPRGTLPLCQKHGRELATAVEKVIGGKMTTLHGGFQARYGLVDLPFEKLPTREKWSADVLSKQYAIRHRAARHIKMLEVGARIDDHYRRYPIQAWRLGDDLLWLALGGEVVIDYNLRLKKELDRGPALWITGYANDVMAYIVSKRVLGEGGYEADSSMIYYGMPAKWAPEVEDRIIRKVQELVKDMAAK